MQSDIKLDDTLLTFEADRVTVAAPDLEVNSLARRPGTDPAALRRALVHDDRDGLTINFGGDYPSGVLINGDTHINGFLSVGGDGTGLLQARTLVLEPPEGSLFVVEILHSLLAKTDHLIPSPGRISAGHIEFLMDSLGEGVAGPGGIVGPPIPVKTMVDLAQTIADLSQQVSDLQRQINELKK